MFTKNKKGISMTITVLVALLIAVVFGLLIMIFFRGSLSKQEGIVGTQIGGIQGDVDKDGLRNTIEVFNGCPCTFGDVEHDGCPATFTDEQKKEDVKKYNSEPVCGIVEGTQQASQQANQQAGQEQKPAAKPTEQKSGSAELKRYQSIEIFGGDDWGADPQDAVIQQACTGWVGAGTCHSEDDDCDGKFNLKPLKEGCWIMASEDDDKI